MARNDFSSEAAENYEQKCLCVLVLDSSGSMNKIVDKSSCVTTGRTAFVDGKLYDVVEGGISRLDKLNEGLQSFYSDIVDDVTTSQRLEVAIISFNDTATTILEPALAENFTMPTIIAKGGTSLADAMNEAIELVEARKNWYKETGQKYYRPWIVLMSDGEPNEDQDIDALAQRLKQDIESKHYTFLPIGVEDADMDMLQSLASDDMPAMKLSSAKFGSFFKWLSASMSTVVANQPESTRDLIKETGDWMEAFTIGDSL